MSASIALRLGNARRAAPARETDLSILEDERLLAMVSRKNVRALEMLYNRYSPRALGLALRILQDRDLAEQVVQDAFWRVWRKAEQYEQKKGRFSTWLFTIVHNLAIDHIRQRRGSVSLDAPELAETIESQADDTDMDENISRQLDGAQVRAALQSLPDSQREVIELVYFEGLSHRQVAKKLSTPLGTVHTRARLGIQKLREALPH